MAEATAPATPTALPAPVPAPETPEDKAARRWLRRFATRALCVEPPMKTLPLGEEGYVSGTKLLAAARGEPGAPEKMTMQTLLACVVTSGGKIQQKHDEKSGILVRGAVREKLEAKEKRQFSEKDYAKLAADAKKDAKRVDKKKLAENEKRWSDAKKHQADQVRLRNERKEKRLEAARQRALRDPKNLRKIADPNNPAALAKIAPPLKRVGQGTNTADARRAVKDRK